MEINNAFSLKRNVFERLKELFGEVQKHNDYSLQRLSSVLKMSELIRFGVSCVEKLELKRKRFSGIDGVYLIQPTQDSIDKVINDLKQKMYNKAHIYFTRKLPQNLMTQFTPVSILQNIKTFKEFYFDFFMIDSNTFHLNMESSLPILYSQGNSIEAKMQLNEISSKLLSVYSSLNQFSSLSIISNPNTNSISNKLAIQFEQQLSLYQDKLKQIENTNGNIYLILIDRSIDAATPLIHDLYYESMIYDILQANPHNSRFSLSSQNQSIQLNQIDLPNSIQNQYNQNQSKLESMQQEQKNKKQENGQNLQLYEQIDYEQDNVLNKYRFKNISDCLKGISEDFQNFNKKYNNIRGNNNNEQDSDIEIKGIIGQVISLKEQLDQYKKHLNIIDKCYNIFQTNNLLEIAEFEQKLMTGVDNEGKQVKPQSIIPQLKSFFINNLQKFSSSNNQIDQISKLRLALLCLLKINLEVDVKQLIFSSFDQQTQQLLININWIDNYSNDSKKLKVSEQEIKHTQQLLKQFKDGVDVDFCRYTPEITLQIEQILNMIFNFNLINETLQKIGFYLSPPIFQFNNNNQSNIIQTSNVNKKNDIQLNQQFSNMSNNSPKKYQVQLEMQNLLRDQSSIKNDNNSSNKDTTNNNNNNSQKVIIFFIGGVSFAEIRSIKQLQEKYFQTIPIVIGSTSILNPNTYIQQLSCMQNYSN